MVTMIINSKILDKMRLSSKLSHYVVDNCYIFMSFLDRFLTCILMSASKKLMLQAKGKRFGKKLIHSCQFKRLPYFSPE